MSSDISTLTVDEFLRSVQRSGLLQREQLEEIRPQALGLQPADFAAKLVDAGHLSRFQARKLLQGRTRGLVIGPYHVLAPIGRGGMSTVYLARDPRVPEKDEGARMKEEKEDDSSFIPHPSSFRLVALKVLPPKQAREEERHLARFIREMEFSQKVEHPHIARTFEVGVSDGVYYIAMEFIRGQSLRRLVSDGGPLTVPRAARLFAETAAGLEHAHQRGVIHRDLKPSNIMVTQTGHAKLLDLGLALIEGEIAEDHMVVGGQGYVVGTMDYIAPEQSEDATNVCPRSDIYGLGCTLYFSLTGRPPFPGGSAMQKIRCHRKEAPTQVESLNESVPPGFAVFVRRLMAKRPEDRPASAEEVRLELLRWADDDARIEVNTTHSTEHFLRAADFEDGDIDSDLEFDEPPALREGTAAYFPNSRSLTSLWWKYAVPMLIGSVAGLILVGLFFLLAR